MVNKTLPQKTSKKRRNSDSSSKRKSKKAKLYNFKDKSYKYKTARVINVANDKEAQSKTVYRNKISKKQKKIVNKRFKNGYSPFQKNQQAVLQLTVNNTGTVNRAKWIWQTFSGLTNIVDAFNNFPLDNNYAGNEIDGGNYYRNAEEQAIYFSEFKNIIEIMNPSNYDQTLIIYDIVYKSDIFADVASEYFEPLQENSIPLPAKYGSPLYLINEGISGTGSNNSSSYVIAKPNQIGNLASINLTPTMS